MLYGTEKIIVPAVSAGSGTLYSAAGNFSLLLASSMTISWKEKWEGMIPIDARQILFIISLILQLLLLIPLVLRLYDCFMYRRGYTLREPHQRTLLFRYRRQHNHVRRHSYELQRLPLHNPSHELERQPSIRSILSQHSNYSTHTNPVRVQRQNEIAMERQFHKHCPA